MAEYVCNLCGAANGWNGEPFERETPGCTACGSTVRTRALIGVLSTELFGTQLSLPDFPRVKSWRGLGTSDSEQYAPTLAKAFDYRNTFYDRSPRFDLAAPPDEIGKYDFVISSDVFEHVAPPDYQAFRNAFDMLKPNGVLVFTVPYAVDESAEHFPDLHEFGLAEVGGRVVLVNRTTAGEIQVKEDLCFHRNGAGTALEMRMFSEATLREALATAGFTDVKIQTENYRPFGIVQAEAWSLPVVARKGSFACSRNAMRDVVEEFRDLKKAFADEKKLARSTWARIGRRLGLG